MSGGDNRKEQYSELLPFDNKFSYILEQTDWVLNKITHIICIVIQESNTLTKKGKSTVSKNRYKDKKPKSPTESELSESETEEEAVAPKVRLCYLQ